MTIQIATEVVGRRVYVTGNSYPVKGKLKAAGCHWDRERKQWWIGAAKADQIDSVVDKLDGKEVKDCDSHTKVIGKAEYKGRKYFVRWAGTCRTGKEKFHLCTLNAQVDFWTDACKTSWLKQYREAMTLGDLQSFCDRRANKPAVTKPLPTEPLNSPPQQAKEGQVLLQGQHEYVQGETLGLLIATDEYESMNNPIEIPAKPSAKPTPEGRVRVAVTVTAAWSYAEDEAEDLDYFANRFWASARAATQAEAGPLIAKRNKALQQKQAADSLSAAINALESVDSQPDWVTEDMLILKWAKPAMIHTASHPCLYVDTDAGLAYYHVPAYFACDRDFSAQHRAGTVTDCQALIELARTSGLGGVS